MRWLMEIALAASIVAAPARSETTKPLRRTDAGSVIGVVEKGNNVYRGIRYAAPPVGPLRWRPPSPPTPWHAPVTATQFGATCPQPAAPGDKGVGSEPQSEDCLTLNIWEPSAHGSTKALPVMVWIHGGGYVNGSASAPLYNGSQLAARGVVVVTLNYRLGRLGFFAHPELGRNANFGLLDQIAALRWIQRNIGAFGGDRHRVTVFGNSAGGESILALMSSPAARGLFRRAIVQSGLGGRELPTLARAQADGSAFAALMRRSNIAAMRALPAADIIAADKPSVYQGFGPIIDGHLVLETIASSFARGHQARIPLIIGANSLEVPVSAIGGPGRIDALLRLPADRRQATIESYPSPAVYQEYVVSDMLFRFPALRLALAHARTGAPTYAYAFDVLSTGAPAGLKGAPHASERAYVFGTLDEAGYVADDQDRSVANDLAERWTNFSRSNHPQVDNRDGWPLVTTDKPKMLHFGRDDSTATPFPQLMFQSPEEELSLP